MTDKSKLGQTAPEFSRSGIYDAAGSSSQFRISDVYNNRGRLGNTYSAGLQFFHANTGESTTDDFHNIGASTHQGGHTEYYGQSAYPFGTSQTEHSSWTKRSTDYHVDNSSLTSDRGSQRGEGIPQWRKLLLDPEQAGAFLSRQWPRVCQYV